MRELKFRAWDGTRMIPNDEIYVYNGNACYKNEYDHISVANGIIMQYTGLKDMSDKEIYEGDIVKLPMVDCGRGDIATFKFDAPNYYLTGIKGDYNIGTPCYSKCFEVIGNIHENPELLEATL